MNSAIPLGDIVDLKKGCKLDSLMEKITGSQRYIQIDDLRNDLNLKFTMGEGIKVDPDDVIIAWDGANAGTVGYGLCGVIGSTLVRLRLKDKSFFGAYVGRFLQGQFTYLRSRCTGATIPHLDGKTLKRLCLKRLSSSEQRKVVDIIDKADGIRQKREQSLQLLEELLSATFLEMFGDFNICKKPWPKKELVDVADVVSGVTKGRKFVDKETVTVPYMRVANVQDGYIDIGDIKTIEVLRMDVDKFRLSLGDILLTEGGDPDKLGRGAVWVHDIKDCIHQNHIFRVRVKDHNEIVPVFLSALIGTSYGKRYFLRAAKQTTGIATINSTQLKKFPVIIPPINLQLKYTKIHNQIELIETKMRAEFMEIDNQFNALMQRYFG